MKRLGKQSSLVNDRLEQAALNKISRPVRAGHRVSLSMASELLSVSSDSVMGSLSDLYASHFRLFDRDAANAAEERVIEYLQSSANGGDPDYLSTDALRCLGRIFQIAWSRDGAVSPTVKKLKAIFEQMVRGKTMSEADSVILIVLEHLFAHQEVRFWFEDWQDDPGLVMAYTEAVRLSAP